jgi:hypothetical protein
MPIFMKQIAGGRRAEPITTEQAKVLVAAGQAKQHDFYTDIYEEVTSEEVAQGYMTRNMEALPAAAKRRGRPPKVVVEDAPTDEAAE